MVNFLKKLTGGESYYLELDENKSESGKPQDQQAKPEAKSEPAKTEAKPEPAKEEKPTKAEPKPAQGEAKPQPVTAPAAPAPATSESKPEPQPDMTFAPDYLLYTRTYPKRRPGPSLDSFRSLARQMGNQ
ncbi:hypothetical protein PN462_18275 [Spirulina sp. CS-785/01]|uniref:hypothetical protein n=1 Tax=Spirulina sp. CS-785/01 TaxID=3021716 RepID=UPI00232AB61C|nr:hypothetical protein [Spirulina sp. CS-785/01]MDB9315067.1 hypothetical protein [Spirulina sp. CS-785/01]